MRNKGDKIKEFDRSEALDNLDLFHNSGTMNDLEYRKAKKKLLKLKEW
jgi:hypothetical protein